jgi:hypothetical protein
MLKDATTMILIKRATSLYLRKAKVRNEYLPHDLKLFSKPSLSLKHASGP